MSNLGKVFHWRCRSSEVDEKSIHSEFLGSYMPLDNTLTIIQLRYILGKAKTFVVVPRDVYRTDGVQLEDLTEEEAASATTLTFQDIYPGNTLTLNDKSDTPQLFTITWVDDEYAAALEQAFSGNFGGYEDLAATGTLKGSLGGVASGTMRNPPLLNTTALGKALPVLDDAEQQVVESFRAACKARGLSSLRALGKHFRRVDDNKNGGVDAEEFGEALREYGLGLGPQEVKVLLQRFDDGDGQLNYEELLRAVYGDMNEFRVGLVRSAFRKLDANKNGTITVEDVQVFYNAKAHPKVASGEKSELEILQKFLGTFDSIDKDGVVTLKEFIEYYQSISISCEDNDEYFALVMRNSWGVQPAAESTMLR